MEKKNQLSIKSIVAIGIGAALFFVLGRFVAIPSPIPNTTINIQYAILAIFGVIYGPVVGFLTGFIGHTLIDLSWGGTWWSWIIASAVFGLIIGLTKNMIKVGTTKLGKKQIITFNVVQVIGHLVAWAVVAPGLDILIYNEPLEKLFVQTTSAVIFNSVATGIVGTIILVSYAKTKTNAGSLNKED